jgi:3-oxoadipate enol-lactonase
MKKIKVNGLELAYERGGSGTPLVLVHGYPLDHSSWEPLVPLLEGDFDLLLPDLRGFGGTAATKAPYQLTDLASDLADLLEALGLQRAIVTGHSMGGYVALAFARLYPQRLLGLGLVSSQALADPPERQAGRLQTAGRVETDGVGEVAGSMPALLTAEPALQARLKELILRQSPVGVAAALRAMAGRPDSSPYLASFEFPVEIIHGLADRIIPVERAREVLSLLKHGHLTELPAAGHMPMLEAPLETAGALLQLKSALH